MPRIEEQGTTRDREKSPDIQGKSQDRLRPYRFHGLDLADRGKDAEGECPSCGRDKFGVRVEDGRYNCFVCGFKGNVPEFLRWLHAEGMKQTSPRKLAELSRARGLKPETLVAWGVCLSPVTGDWLVPGYGPGGKLDQLYRYSLPAGGKKPTLMATAGVGAALFGTGTSLSKSAVHLCEGAWDGMALWEYMGGTKPDGLPTINPALSLLGGSDVLAVPGCNTFPATWVPLFRDKVLTVAYHNDHPRKNGGRVSMAGWDGTRRVADILHKSGELPKEVRYLHWGDGGYDPALADGYDIRDALKEGPTRVREVLAKVRPIPPDWLAGTKTGTKARPGEVGLESLPCSSWNELVGAWRRAMRWPSPGIGLDHALSTMLAVVVSTRAAGDQLWVRVIGPPGCGKSQLCEALAVARDHVLSLSTMTGFHSGYDSSGRGDEDNSLTTRLFDKTLVTKDGDTLLQSPNLPQILSQARDIYDRVSRAHYRNKVGHRTYEGLNMTWLLCGTSSLHGLDSSELGERFLNCVVMDGIDPDEERDILRKVAYRTIRNMGLESNGKVESRQDGDMTAAMQLTGGYVNYLREKSATILGNIKTDDGVVERIMDMGTFVSYMRARPSIKQEESTERELASRLTGQLLRLAICLAGVLNKEGVDDQVMARVKRVALDTARGRTQELCRLIRTAPERSVTVSELVLRGKETEAKARDLLRFLRRIGGVESFRGEGRVGTTRWRLSEQLREVWDRMGA